MGSLEGVSNQLGVWNKETLYLLISFSYLLKGLAQGTIKGSVMTKGETSISHILFVDDNILFCKATKEEWEKVKMILNLYEKGFGQVVNSKQRQFFSVHSLIREHKLR